MNWLLLIIHIDRAWSGPPLLNDTDLLYAEEQKVFIFNIGMTKFWTVHSHQVCCTVVGPSSCRSLPCIYATHSHLVCILFCAFVGLCGCYTANFNGCPYPRLRMCCTSHNTLSTVLKRTSQSTVPVQVSVITIPLKKIDFVLITN